MCENMMHNECEFSTDRKYRYTLKHIWDSTKDNIVFIGLNPSTADENKLDPTLRRIRGFASSWGYGSFTMLNAFAFRATNPSDMKSQDDPIGPENNSWIKLVCGSSDISIACWGVNGAFMNRGEQIRRMLDKLYYIKLTKDGYPSHPLYLKKDLTPSIWEK